MTEPIIIEHTRWIFKVYIELPNGLPIIYTVRNLDKDKWDDPPYQEFEIEVWGQKIKYESKELAEAKIEELAKIGKEN